MALDERLRSDKRPEPRLLRSLVKARGAVDPGGVGEREGLVAQLLRPLGQRLGERGCRQEAEGTFTPAPRAVRSADGTVPPLPGAARSPLPASERAAPAR